MSSFTAPAFLAAFIPGLVLSLSLIMAIGPQNAHVMRMGLTRQHLWLTIAVCVATDVALIAVGVAGLAQLGGLSDRLVGAMTGGGAVVLLIYGAQAMRRFLNPVAVALADGPQASGAARAVTRRQAVVLALTLSWLNPHAWLDTAVVIGTASLAYAQPQNAVFGLGAAVGSTLWFASLGLAMAVLGRRMDSPVFWRALDGLVALMMWGTALWLLAGLL
ncbi:LysE family transporter [Polaromonas sp. YR568]|uniref:LysE/ArgO family amino acid transporter n=1 Tax=Polaromonas sp. YR568 TaxID=1855301 RepID=UPI0031378C0C